jgi:adenylyltransferase/sulfurtransferase
VLGVLPGVIGTLQATEAIKLIAGIGEPLVGRLLLFDALAMTFRTIELRRDPECPSCGVSARGVLVDYDLACDSNAVRSIAPLELAARLERGDDIDVVDVREPYEWQIARLDGARLVPLGQLELEMGSFDPARDTVVYCKTGRRSAQAAGKLAAAGIRNVFNLDGGVVRWRGEVDPTFPQY